MNKVLLSLVTAGVGASVILPVQARPHPFGQHARSGTYQNSRGGSGTFTQNYSHTPGSTSGSSSFQGANGHGFTHTFNNNWNKSTGTGTHESSTTYNDGKTSSSQGSITKTGQGDYSYAGTHTGVNGQTTDVSRTSSFNSSTDTRTVDSTYTNPTTGKSSTVDKSVGYDPSAGTRTVDKTATGPNGKTSTSDQTFTKTNDGYTRDGTLTGPNGKTATDQSTVTFTKDANGDTTRTQTSEVTGPNGKEHTGSNTETYSQSTTPASPNPAPASVPTTTPVD
jgi:hypothetical protein